MALPQVIYMMGPPGAGKGTQAELLAQKINYHRFSTGDAFRAMARQNTPLGHKVNDIIHGKGKLMPGEDAAAVVIEAVKKLATGKQGLIFDGTPRTLVEANIIDEFFTQAGYGRPLAIVLKVDKEDMITRNSKRKFCLNINNDFPVTNDKEAAKCVALGGIVGARADDAVDKIEARWQEFTSKTAPVIAKYKAEGIVQEIDGKRSVQEVFSDIATFVDSLPRA